MIRYDSICIKFQKIKLIYNGRKQISGSLGKELDVCWPEGMRKRNYIKNEETFRADRHVHFLDCGDGFTDPYTG